MNQSRTVLLTAAALIVLGACGSDGKASPATPTVANATTTAAATISPLGGKAVQLQGDPCALLTVAEIEVVLGSGVEQGGFGDDLPGRCTYSLGGDVGAGVVQIVLQDPLNCNAVMKALDSGSLAGSNATPVDLGDGGFYVQDGEVVFTTGGGCVAVGGSKGGINLGPEKLVAFATQVFGRVG